MPTDLHLNKEALRIADQYNTQCDMRIFACRTAITASYQHRIVVMESLTMKHAFDQDVQHFRGSRTDVCTHKALSKAQPSFCFSLHLKATAYYVNFPTAVCICKCICDEHHQCQFIAVPYGITVR